VAIKVKTHLLQVRTDKELLDSFKVICEERGFTVSEGIRRFMQHQVRQAAEGKYLSGQATAKTE
jgi:antitoxin component of RelBE/YafQ-DinJ toxin-antitoxin module